MKKVFKVALVAACMLFAGSVAEAQVKIGYINFNILIDQMPETKAISAQLQTYSKQFMDQLNSMNKEYTDKGQAFQAAGSTMTDAVRTVKAGELQDLQKRMQDYQTTAQQNVEAKRNELGKPLIDKARAVVAQVAKEKGFNYVIDTSQVDLIVSPAEDNLMTEVKAKLGLK